LSLQSDCFVQSDSPPKGIPCEDHAPSE
jgi:hypothetical protein